MNIKIHSIYFAALAMIGAPALATASPEGGHNHFEQTSGALQTHSLDIITRHPPGPHSDAHYEFRLSDDEIPSGWTTIRLNNQSSSTHFGFMVRVPDELSDITVEEYMDAVSLPFQDAWDPYFAGEIDVEGFFGLLLPAMPEWFESTVPIGGPGLTSGNTVSQTTLDLKPGTYFIECYILDDEGVFHTTHGMVEKLVVTEPADETSAPEADHQVLISSSDGLVFDAAAIQPGHKTFEVVFEDNDIYGHGLGHDVHLVRIDGDTSISELNDWMNYLDVGADLYYADRGALISASGHRGPQTFIGGVQSMFPDSAAGDAFPLTAYFHASLRPGRYALVSEVPNPIQPDPDNPEMSMLVEFSVTPGAGLTGAWFDPATNGQGWNLMAAPHGVFGFFYGYSDDGSPLWLMTEESIEDVVPGEPVTFNLLYGSGGSFANPVSPEELVPWGEVTFTFENCGQATATMTGADGTQTSELVRVAQTAGLSECGL